MKRIIGLVIAASFAVSLSGCASRDATIEDCMITYIELGKPAEAVMEVCLDIYQKVIDGEMTQEEFNENYLPE